MGHEAPLLGFRVLSGGGGVAFGAYAPSGASCAVQILRHTDGDADDEGAHPDGGKGAVSTFPMRPVGDGYFSVDVAKAKHGTRYQFVLGDRVVPDPFARFLPDGVHGPAMVVESTYVWRHAQGVARPLSEQVIYELHVGTFTDRGDYQGARERLKDLAALGVTTVEVMPIAAFAGSRGWGYDGVALFAPFAPYGQPDDLRAFIDDAHGLGLSVLLDVVYNHLGPSGNYLPAWCSEYFTSEIRNAWGDSINYAHPVMRRLVVDNALYWLTDFRVDGLRLDATHAIADPASDRHILGHLSDEVARLRPRKVLIAEDDRNDSATVTDLGMNGVWADDFHHQVAVTMTGERDGYYGAYEPGVGALAQTINRGWLYEGQMYPHSGKPRGRDASQLDAAAFVYCLQNHDQVGNRALGERLSSLVSPESYRAVSTLLLFLPMTPLLFMGQEWAASTPFLFFTDHDPELGRAVSEGRREEFKTFRAFSDPAVRVAIPDPQDPSTFAKSKLDWNERDRDEHRRVVDLYTTLLALRRNDPVMRASDRHGLSARAVNDVLIVNRVAAAGERCLLVNFGGDRVPYADLSLRWATRTPDGAPRVVFASDGDTGDRDVLPPHAAVILRSDDSMTD